MNQHPRATKRINNIGRNVRHVERRLGRTLDSLSACTPDGWPTGGQAEGHAKGPASSPTLNAALAGLTPRDTRWQIDTLLARLEADTKALADIIDLVQDIGVDTAAEARLHRCNGWGARESVCDAIAVTRNIVLEDGRIIRLCGNCQQQRYRDQRREKELTQ